METGRQGMSISKDVNEETDIENRRVRSINVDDEEEEDNENVGVGRTYECSYCKRGFTNAQALGGHMNIHRKDKAKAKAKQHPIFSSSFYTSSSCSSDSIVSKKPKEGELISTFSSTLVPQMGNYQVYNYDPLANPRPRSGLSQPSTDDYGRYNFSMNRRSSAVNTSEEDLGSDLSLGINSSSSRTNHQPEEEKKNDDVDLELRLGYD